jgi:hypothetical protein
VLFDDSKQPGENGEEANAQQLAQFGRKLSDQNLLQVPEHFVKLWKQNLITHAYQYHEKYEYAYFP